MSMIDLTIGSYNTSRHIRNSASLPDTPLFPRDLPVLYRQSGGTLMADTRGIEWRAIGRYMIVQASTGYARRRHRRLGWSNENFYRLTINISIVVRSQRHPY